MERFRKLEQKSRLIQQKKVVPQPKAPVNSKQNKV